MTPLMSPVASKYKVLSLWTRESFLVADHILLLFLAKLHLLYNCCYYYLFYYNFKNRQGYIKSDSPQGEQKDEIFQRVKIIDFQITHPLFKTQFILISNSKQTIFLTSSKLLNHFFPLKAEFQ